jgi:hypothetical protein
MKFNVGDRVKLSDKGRGMYTNKSVGEYQNPHNREGTISEIKGGGFPYVVQWDSKGWNAYQEVHLSMCSPLSLENK